MDNSGIYVGLDIGTTSIKVIVAEKVKGQINVLGVGNVASAGIQRGIIVDIDKAARSIKHAVSQAEEKASIQIHRVIVGIPADMIRIKACSGMVTISGQSREINNDDVRRVTLSAMIKNLPSEREVIDTIPDEFVVDGFDGIQDPRGMVGVRLEMHGHVITGPRTIIHNTKKAVREAGLQTISLIVNPLAQGRILLDDGERDFGTILIDIGGGQTTAAVVHNHQLQFVTVDNEGGKYITKDISVVLDTSNESAEKLKRDYGYADSLDVSNDNQFPVEVVGRNKPVEVSEKTLSEIIQARLEQIFGRIKKDLDQVSALNLPGGIVLTGGVAALPGISELAADYFNTNVKVYIPNQMGLRHPSFALPLSLVAYQSQMSQVDLLVRSALTSKNRPIRKYHKSTQHNNRHLTRPQSTESHQSVHKNKKRHRISGEGIRRFFSDFFN